MEICVEGKKKRGEGTESTTLSETTPANLHALGSYFYKTIVAPSTQRYKLRIPEKYVKTYYEEQLAKDYVKLKVKDGRVWRVELFKESGKVWLAKGWECFVKKYSLKFGYFLLFGHDETDSEFHVTIFDLTGCEIEYELSFDDHTMAQEVKGNSSQDRQDEEMVQHNDDYATTQEADDGVVDEKKTSVKERLEAFKSGNPHFKVFIDSKIMKSIRDERHRLCVSSSYARVHFKGKHLHDLILKGPDDEKSYTLTSYMYINPKMVQIYGYQWRDFVADYKLHVGDACVFELIDPRSNTYKATIFHDPDWPGLVK